MIEDKELILLLRERAEDPARRVDKPDPRTEHLHPPADEPSVDLAEDLLGFKFPSLLRACYIDVANGGFGPGYGIIGIEGGCADQHGRDLTKLYEELTADFAERHHSWPDGVLPLCDWTGEIWSCVDCRDGKDLMVTLHPEGLFKTKRTISEWFEAWLHGIPLWDEMFDFTTTKTRSPFDNEISEFEKPGTPQGDKLN